MKNSTKYLREKFEFIKKRNPKFTLRALAQRLKLKSHSHLSRILSGEKPVPISYLPVIVDSFKLSEEEAIFLECLIMIDRSLSDDEREFYETRLRQVKRKANICFEYTSKTHYLSNPIYPLLLELTETKNFKNDLNWIKKRLPFKTTKNEIQEAIGYLIEIEMLELKEGKLSRTYKHIKSKDDNIDQTVRNYHKMILGYAQKSLNDCPVENRMFNSFSLPINFKEIKKIKDNIEEYTRCLISEIEAEKGAGDEVYQFNINFFPMTNIQETL